MHQIIKNILVPLDFSANNLSFVKQVAELAKQHGAEMHLLYTTNIRDWRSSTFPWLISPNEFSELVKEKTSLLTIWKRWLERDYGIRVTTIISYDKKEREILHQIEMVNADLVALLEQPQMNKWFAFWPTTVERIIKKSPCQVITFFSDKATISDWKQVVIPITDFIPELRIQTIIDTAKIFKLKIHLVTIPLSGIESRPADFFYLTETLKRLKPAGNVQVECRCLKNGSSPIAIFLSYARSIGADIMMTNMQVKDNDKSLIREINFFLEY